MPAYYSEFDPKAAAWLRELIKRGLIADGEVDERSIVDVRPADLRGFAQCHFFAGIGVWSYALRSAGWSDERPVWTGSAPCQPFSAAGKGRSSNDERHLWPEFYRLIRACQPPVVFGEQVSSSIAVGADRGEAVRALWERQAYLRICAHGLERRVSEHLQDMQERDSEGTSRLALYEYRYAGEPIGCWGEEPFGAEGAAIRLDGRMGAATAGNGAVRGDGDHVQPVGEARLEHAITRSDHAGSRVHEDQHEADTVRTERSIRELGRAADGRYGPRDIAEAAREVAEAVNRNWRSIEAADGWSWIDTLQIDLEDAGYSLWATDICAAGLGAPHIRQRLYWVAERLADTSGSGQPGAGWGGEAQGQRASERGRESGLGGLEDPNGERRDGVGLRLQSGKPRLGDAEASGRGEDGGLGNPGRQSGQWNAGSVSGAQAAGGGSGRADGHDDHGHPDAGATVGLADAEHDDGRSDVARRGPEGRAADGGRGAVGGLADADGDGPLDGINGSDGRRSEAVAERGINSGVANAAESGRSAWGRPADEGDGRGATRVELGRLRGAGGRPGPTNGLWRDADWLFCRDGKWRPVRPSAQQMVDGSTGSLGRVRDSSVASIERDVEKWAQRHQVDPGQAMRDLWDLLSQEEAGQRTDGGFDSVREAPFLLAFLRQLSNQGWRFPLGDERASSEASRTVVRVLRFDAAPAYSSRERGLEGQSDGELTDPLRELSQIVAHHTEECWGLSGWQDVGSFPLVKGAEARVARLRGYGNAIVAPVAQAFIEAYLEAASEG